MSFIAAAEEGFKQVKDKERNYFKLGSGVAVVKEIVVGENTDSVPFSSFRFKVESSSDAAHYPGEVVTRGFLFDSPGWKNRTRFAECVEIMEVLKPGFKRMDPSDQAAAIKAASDDKSFEGVAVTFQGVQKTKKKTGEPIFDKEGKPIVTVNMALLEQTDAEKAARLAWLGNEND